MSLKFSFRQKNSYDSAIKFYGSSVTNIVTSDTAFVLGVLRPQGKDCKENVYDVVIQLRKDHETLFDFGEASKASNNTEDKFENNISVRLCHYLIAKGVARTCQPISWLTPKITDLDRSKGMPEFLASCLKQAVGVLSLGRVVVTDRLHGTIVSYLAGKNIVYVENKSNKTTGVLSTAFSSPGIQQQCISQKAGILQARPNFEDIADKVQYLLKFRE